MVSLHFLWPVNKAAMLCIPPLLYGAGGFASQCMPATKQSISKSWSLVRFISAAITVYALACCFYAFWLGQNLSNTHHTGSIFRIGQIQFSFRFDLVESLMLLLVTFLGWVISRYSSAYMAGDRKERVYITRLLYTLSAVTLLVVTNNLLVFLAAWIMTSLALHGLLTLYGTRQAAVIAAHKKFLASRLGDLTLLCGVLLLGHEVGSFELSEVADTVTKLPVISLSIHLAAFLLAVSAIIKCAQLPLHGWLIQVMEAPTPVSALLHAGIVNLGGFMLIRLASVINTTEAAQALLVGIGCLTAMVGSLVMTTRISVKVYLAWSTCAQMGFMLVECGLGLYHLAFLHLLAHSLYKAHAFLSSGGTVNETEVKRSFLPTHSHSLFSFLGSLACGLVLAAIGQRVWGPITPGNLHSSLPILLAGMAIAGLFSLAASRHRLAGTLGAVSLASAISLLYFGYEALFHKLIPLEDFKAAPHSALFFLVIVCFALLYGIQTAVRLNPVGSFATALYPWLYAGLYLDEAFTRTTFRIWPAKREVHGTPRRDAIQTFETAGEGL